MKKKRESLIMCPMGTLACKAGKCRYWNEKKKNCEPRLKNPGKYSLKIVFEKKVVEG